MNNWYIKIADNTKQNLTTEEIYELLEKHGPKGVDYPGEQDSLIESYKEKNIQDLLNFHRRFRFVAEYSWAFPDKKIIDYMKRFIGNDSAIEIGAGHGLWSRLLKDIGINIVATDPQLFPSNSISGYNISDINKQWTNVEKMNHIESLNNFPNANVLILIWPSYQETYANESLNLFKGNKVIYIGEWKGCTADDNFHDSLCRNWKLVNADHVEIDEKDDDKSYDITRWRDIYDDVYFFVRK